MGAVKVKKHGPIWKITCEYPGVDTIEIFLEHKPTRHEAERVAFEAVAERFKKMKKEVVYGRNTGERAAD